MFGFNKPLALPTAQEALPGREQSMPVPERHFVLGTPLTGPFPDDTAQAMFGLGCFWGAERKFWETEGIYTTAVGYAGGVTPNPNYREVCTGMTGHNEVVLVIYKPAVADFDSLLRIFFEAHDPTQGMRQGNDVGTQYRSGIYCFDAAQHERATALGARYGDALKAAGYGPLSTEIILPAPTFYYAEDYHQQYLAKNPGGYCGLGGTGVPCAAPAATA